MNRATLAAIVLALAAAPYAAQAAATITIVNGDTAAKGFNDPKAVDPVGGNSGTTLGKQRLIAFQAAADKWGANLNSTIPIRILATWEALACTDGSAVLGSAGASEIFRNFANAPRSATWYSKAQANAIAGTDLDDTTADIRARFNVNLGSPGCLTGVFFYLGLDNNHGNNADLVTILTHEFGHGLGFQTYTNGISGAQTTGSPSIWDYFLLDTSTGLTWDKMTADQRAASTLKPGKLAWNGPNVTSAALNMLWWGTPSLSVTQPDSVAGAYPIGTASFGPALADPAVNGAVATFTDTDPNVALACDPLSAANAAAVAGKIALVDRGICTFVIKALNLQTAGAIGVLVADNVAGSPPPGLGGADPRILIPTVRISQGDGVTLKAAIAAATSPVMAALGINPYQLQGADPNGLVLMYATDPFQSGSTVSHFDTSAFPNQLMEPFINDDLTHEVTPPYDLTLMLLRDIGWP